MKKINVLFDADILVNGILFRNLSRCGVFFVAYNIAKQIKERKDVNLFFYLSGERKLFYRHYIQQFEREAIFKDIKILGLETFDNVEEKKIYKSYDKYIVYKNKRDNSKNLFSNFIFSLLRNFYKKLYKYYKSILISKSDSNYNNELDKIEVFLSPLYKVPEVIKYKENIKKFILLHDTIPEILQEYRKTMEDKNSWFKKLIDDLNKSYYYFCISQCTKNDFLKYFQNKLDKNKMYITYLAASDSFKINKNKEDLENILDKYKIRNRQKYIFSLCSLEPRKNLIFTIKCFLNFIKQYDIKDLYFYLGGAQWPEFTEKLNSLLDSFCEYKDRVIILGYVDDEDLNVLYSNSLFFVYLSQYEGFGLPIIEAMKCGVPVITSNNSSIPEVVGDAAITIDYNSEVQCIKAFKNLYFNELIRQQYSIEGIKRSNIFSWEKTVDKMIEIFSKILM